MNEIHYWNNGTDVQEGVEVVGPANTDLLGWTVQRITFQSLRPFASAVAQPAEIRDGGPRFLRGILEDEGRGFGAKWFDMTLENGKNRNFKAVALVDRKGSVRDLVSYTGM